MDLELVFKLLDDNKEIDSFSLEEPIYLDDTIENLKYKLSKKLPVKNIKHYYLFYKKNKIINAYDIFKQLSHNNTRPINKQIFVSFCMNHNLRVKEDKEYYDIGDFLQLKLDVSILVNEPIGTENKTYIVNPYDNVFEYYENVASTSNNLIMNYPNIMDNTIYVCLANNVYKNIKHKELELDHTINVYFPYLFSEKNIELKDEMENSDAKYEKYNNMIHFHHSKYNSDISTKQKGIVSIYFVIYTKQSFLFPLDIFFKLVQSTLTYPFIKLNPGKKQENLYRLYSPKMSENGNKVPLFKKNKINKIINVCKKHNTLYYIIEQPYKGKAYTVIFEIDNKGHIHFSMNDLELLTFDGLEEFVNTITKDIIDKLIEFFDPSQKIFNYFESLKNENVEIVDMKYKYIFKKQPKLDLNKYIKCFSSIFNFVEEKEKIRLRYKRVSNFNETDSIDAYVIDLINQQLTRESIINSLSHAYNITLEVASQKFGDIISIYTAHMEMKQNRIFRITNNPGFSVDIFKKERTVEVEIGNINNVSYIDALNVYVNNLILFSQNLIKDTDVKNLCDAKDVKIVEIEYEHISDNELNFTDNAFDAYFREKPIDEIEESEEDLLKRLDEYEKEREETKTELELHDTPVLDEEILAKIEEKSAEDEDEIPVLGSNAEVDAEGEVEDEGESPVALGSNAEGEAEDEAEDEDESPVALGSNAEDDAEGESEDESESPVALGSNAEDDAEGESEDESPVALGSNAEGDAESEADDESPVILNSDESPVVLGDSNNSDSDKRNKISGGTVQDRIYNLFIYDHHNKKDISTLIDKKDITWIAAELKDYFRVFVSKDKGKVYSTLIEQSDTTCRGSMTKVNQEQLEKIGQIMGERNLIKVDIYDKEGNKYDGNTFIHPYNITGKTIPNEYIKEVYDSVKNVWKELDGGKKLYIYDNEHNLKGTFNGTTYNDKEDPLTLDAGHANPFLKRLQEKEPTLFLKEDDAQYSQYSRLCLWNYRRQPVILTKEEKDEIDKESPGAYDGAVEYGTDPNNKFFYICPRYWNLKTNMPMLEQDVDKTKIIDQKIGKAKNIKDKYIFEFSTDKYGHYPTPGFLDSKSHPKGHFIPCCFKMKNDPKMVEEYKQKISKMTIQELLAEVKKEKIKRAGKVIPADDLKSMNEQELIDLLIENKSISQLLINRKDAAGKRMAEETIEEKTGTDKYIQNGLKFPLDKQRLGFLTLSLEKFFHITSNDYYENMKTKKFKKNKILLFRHGIEQNKNTSFLTCIGYIFDIHDVVNKKKVYSLDITIKYILSKLTIDTIQTYHNGRIVHTFAHDFDDQDIEKYKTSKLYTILDLYEFKRAVNGYENFIKYIKDTTKYVDHTYLWDIICSLNEHINMIILYEPMDDVTHNLSIICPTSLHSKFSFTIEKPTIILYKKGDLYEPIMYCKKENTKKLTTIDTTEYNFMFKITSDMPFIINILKSINESLGDKCKHKLVNKEYKFKQNISLNEIQKELPSTYKIVKQIMNYDGTIIGAVILNEIEIEIFIPCKPGSIEPNIKVSNIDDNIWENYENTVSTLKKLYLESNKKILCKPLLRVVEDGMIVGIITMTNQFVQLNEPEPNVMEGKDMYGLDVIEEHNYISADYTIIHNPLSLYKNRMIHRLKLEQRFYNAYFNTLKIEINDFKNFMIRQSLETIIQSQDIYPSKIQKMKDILKPIIKQKINYTEYTDKLLDSMETITLCKSEKSNYCTTDGVLLIPSKNLYTKQNNSDAYLTKFVDGILRNHNVKLSIFDETHSTVYYTDKYNLSDKEILILESILIPYLEHLGETIHDNNYITYRSFEDLQPNEVLDILDKVEINGYISDDFDIKHEPIVKPVDLVEPVIKPVNDSVIKPVNDLVEPVNNSLTEEQISKLERKIGEDEARTLIMQYLTPESKEEQTQIKEQILSIINESNITEENIADLFKKVSKSEGTELIMRLHDLDPHEREMAEEEILAILDNLSNKSSSREVSPRRILDVEPKTGISDSSEDSSVSELSDRINEKLVEDAEADEESEEEEEEAEEDSDADAEDKEEDADAEAEDKEEEDAEEESDAEEKEEDAEDADAEEKEEEFNTEINETNKVGIPNDTHSSSEEEFNTEINEPYMPIKPLLKLKVSKKGNCIVEVDPNKENKIDTNKCKTVKIILKTNLKGKPKPTLYPRENVDQPKKSSLYDCFKVDYPTEKWKVLFPKKTKRFRWNLDEKFRCNFLLILHIFKEFNDTYRNYKINDVRKLLIASYDALRVDHENDILLKWKVEGKSKYADLIKNRGVSFATILSSEDYFITSSDLIILMFHYNLPIVLLYQQKNKIKTMAVLNEDETEYYIYIKIVSKKQFLLHISNIKGIGSSLRFYNKDMMRMLKNIEVLTVNEYLHDKIL